MVVTLAPMSAERLPSWIAAKTRLYAQSRHEAGETAAQAERTALESEVANFPNGRPLDSHRIFDVLSDGTAVGSIWMGAHPQIHDGLAWWVYDIEIDADQRGRGWGRRAMELAEAAVAEEGGTSLGLNVFGFNTVAQSLYSSLGYAVTSQQMSKRVG